MNYAKQDAQGTASTAKQVLGRAAVVATILGSTLTLVNQSQAIFGDGKIQRLPLILVYFTPFLVVIVSQTFGIREARKASVWIREFRESFAETLFSHGIPGRAVALALAVGSVNTAIVVGDSVLTGYGLEQLPIVSMLQALILPVVFGALSQALSFRRAIQVAGLSVAAPTSRTH